MVESACVRTVTPKGLPTWEGMDIRNKPQKSDGGHQHSSPRCRGPEGRLSPARSPPIPITLALFFGGSMGSHKQGGVHQAAAEEPDGARPRQQPAQAPWRGTVAAGRRGGGMEGVCEEAEWDNRGGGGGDETKTGVFHSRTAQQKKIRWPGVLSTVHRGPIPPGPPVHPREHSTSETPTTNG